MRLRTRRPFAGLALGACAGILLAEAGERHFGRGPCSTWENGAWLACGLFLSLALLFTWLPRRWVCWTLVVAGFTTLHLLRLNDPPSTRLAAELARDPGFLATQPEDEDEDHLPKRTPPAPDQVLRARGTILNEPQSSAPTGGSVGAAGGRNWRFTLGLNHVAVHGQEWDSRASVRVFWRNGPPTLASGERLELTGTGSAIQRPRNPGEFDLEALLRRRDIRTEISCSGISDVHALPANIHRWPPTIPSLARRFQDWTQRHLTLDLDNDPEASAVITTLLLGLRTEPGLGDLQPMFQRTGTLHFFAIDGLKLGLLSVLLVRALAFFGVRRQWAGTLVLPLLLLYALATGLGPASLRAVFVAAVFVGGEWLDRPARPLNSLGAAATLILAFDTNQLFELSFQLTFLVVLSILLLGVPLRTALIRVGAPDPFLPPRLYPAALRISEWLRRRVIELACISFAASVGSLPLMLFYYHVVSPVSVIANVAVFPAALGMIALGLLSLAVSVVSQTWAAWVNNGNWLLAKTLLAAVRFFDAVPGGSFYCALPDGHWKRPGMELTVLDLQRGARSIHLHARHGGDWLIDTGRTQDYQRSISPFLHFRGLAGVDGLILGQADIYHLGAASLVLGEAAPHSLFDSGPTGRSIYQRDFARLVEQRRLPLSHWRRGDSLVFSPGNEMRVFYPPDHPVGQNAGDRALVLQMRAAGWRVLFLGDSGAATIRWLSEHEAPEALRSDVVVLGAAWQPLENTPGLLREIAPRLIVRESPKEEPRGPETPPRGGPAAGMLSGASSGAITLRLYSRKLEAAGFVDGASITLER